MTNQRAPVEWRIHEAALKENSRLKREIRELKSSNEDLLRRWSEARRSMANRIQREAQQQARQYLFGEH